MRAWENEAVDRGRHRVNGLPVHIKSRVMTRDDGTKCLFAASGKNGLECDQILATFLDERCTCWTPPSECKLHNDPVA
jgi:hypothetical protein